MRIIVLDSDTAFTNDFARRCKAAGVFCQVFAQSGPALLEIRKNPDSVDLLIVCREFDRAEGGLAVAEQLRKDPKTQDVPYIISSSTWGKVEFARHQKSNHGANAYFSKKSPVSSIEPMIHAVTGFRFTEGGAKDSLTGTVTGAGTVTGFPSVSLLPADQVLSARPEGPKGIKLETPISLFDNPVVPEPPQAAAPQMAPLEPPKAPPVAPAAVSGSAEIPSRDQLTPSRGIEISMGPETGLEIESSQRPGQALGNATPPKPPAPEISLGGGSIVSEESLSSISLGGDDLQIPAVNASVIEKINEELEQEQQHEAAVVPPSLPPEARVSEEEAAEDLPYLFSESNSRSGSFGATKSQSTPRIPAGFDPYSSTPGSGSNEVETLKKYLTMREQDIAVLTAQLGYAKEELSKSEAAIKRLDLQNEDMHHKLSDAQTRLETLEQERQYAGKSMEGEVEQLRFELKSKIDRIKFLEERLKDSAEQYEKLKERVRADIRKIRVRERELESKLEILKRDSETLIAARENKILELKRKIDLLEFNYDTLQDKTESEKQNVQHAREKLERVMKVLRLALGIIEGEEEKKSSNEDKNAA